MGDICLFGAGNTGKRFVENGWLEKFSNKGNVYFCDNNAATGTKIYGLEVYNQIMDIDRTEVIITSLFYEDIYFQCVEAGAKVIGIYNPHEDKIYESYKERCSNEYSHYHNIQYVVYERESLAYQDEGIEKFERGDDLFSCINRVAIMISNLCNYACLHKACPAFYVKEKEIMPSDLVHKIIDELAAERFNGEVCFHIYNEPLMDPRLFQFIDYTKRNIKNVKVHIYTNGYYLNNTMVKELQDIHVDKITTTAYGKEEWHRLIDLDVEVAYRVLFGNLDERLNMYDDNGLLGNNKRCVSYFTQIPIYSNGDIGLCCLDYNHPYNFGNVNDQSIKEIINSNKATEFQRALLTGDRSEFMLCKNCQW